MPDYLKAVYKVREAVATKDFTPYLTYFLVRDKRLWASDGRMVATAPIEDDREYLVSAGRFEAALRAAPGDAEVVMGEGFVTVKHGRFRSRIPTLPLTEAGPYGVPEGKRVKVDPEFVNALRIVRPFISDNATHDWALCAAIQGGQVYATNNVSLVASPVALPKSFRAMLPKWAVDYIIKRAEALTHIATTDMTASFWWADGSWLRTQLVGGEFPEKAVQLLAEFQAPTTPITPEWLEAFLRVCSLAEDKVVIGQERIVGTGENGEETTEDIVTDGLGADTTWTVRFLKLALNGASHWAPYQYPNPASFAGDRLRGLIMGRV